MITLFIYGTLIDPDVQEKVIGRTVTTKPNTLKGFKKDEIIINGNKYFALVPDDKGLVEGYTTELSNDELKMVDEYETSAYKRIEVALSNGLRAFIYIKV